MSLALLAPSSFAADAATVQARFDLDDRRGSPFPSDRFTVEDSTQNTGLRVNLPKPDCTARANDCQNLDVIHTLDGFNVQPRPVRAVARRAARPVLGESVSSTQWAASLRVVAN